jgi:hypothetical protein
MFLVLSLPGVVMEASFQELQQLAAKYCGKLSRELKVIKHFDLSDEGLFLLAKDFGADDVRAVIKYPVHDYIALLLEFKFHEKEKVAIVCRAYYSVEKLNVKRSGSTRIDVYTESLLRVSCFPEGWSTEEF